MIQRSFFFMSFLNVHSKDNQALSPLESVSSERTSQEPSHPSISFDSKELEVTFSEPSRKISFSNVESKLEEGIQKEARQVHQMELSVTSATSFSQRKVISDDFPPFTTLGRYLGNIYKKGCERWSSFWLPVLERPLSVSDSQPLFQKEGFTGLSNHHGTCYLNAALQMLKVGLTIVLEQGIPEEQKRVNEALITRLPSMLNLMNGELQTEIELQQLYREVAHELASDLWYSWKFEEGIGVGQLETGYKRNGHTIQYLAVLLHQLGVAPLYLEYTRHDCTEYHSRQHLAPECFLSLRHQSAFYSPNIGPLVQRSLQQSSSTAPVKERSLQEVIERGFAKEGCQFAGPFPAILGIEVTGYNLKINESFSLSKKEESLSSYEVMAITISCNQHAFSLIRKNDTWYEVNDNMIFPIPKKWKKEFDDYVQAHGSFVLFRKKEILPTRLETTSQEPKDLLLESEERKLLGQVKQTFQYWPKGPTPFKDLRKLIERLSTHSFFFKQFARGLEAQEISLSADPFLKATQEVSQAHKKALQTQGSGEELAACWEAVIEKTKEVIRALEHDSDFDPAVITEVKLAWEDSLVLFTKEKEEAVSKAVTRHLKAV